MSKNRWKIAEKLFERWLFRSRWLLLPFYVGLVVALISLYVVYGVIFLTKIFAISFATDFDLAVLYILSLIDVVLVGNLIVIVLFAGYENFVSKFDNENARDRPTWMENMSFAGLKLKLFSSIVAISGIQLLKAFMAIGQQKAFSQQSLFWLTVIHLTFVASTVLFALDHHAEPGRKSDVAKPPRTKS